MKNFELFMGHVGNGLIVWNKAVEEHGDYKKICHIKPYGEIIWYVRPENIPDDAFETIKTKSEKIRGKFDSWLDEMPVTKRYFALLDYVPFSVQVSAIEMTGKTERKIEYMKSYLYKGRGK